MAYGNQMTPPVSEGEELNVTIEAVGEKGDGIAKKDGFVLFVPNTRQGEQKRVRITKVLKSVGFAEVIGDATAAPAAPQREQKPAQPVEEFDPHPELDSEDFGEE